MLGKHSTTQYISSPLKKKLKASFAVLAWDIGAPAIAPVPKFKDSRLVPAP